MVLFIFKNKGTRRFLATNFKMNLSFSQCSASKFVESLFGRAYDEPMVAQSSKMLMLLLRGINFFKYNCDGYITDAILHQSLHSTGTVINAQKYYSRWARFLGYLTKFSVLPQDIAIVCSHIYTGFSTPICMF